MLSKSEAERHGALGANRRRDRWTARKQDR
jgi:hypothetical protein